MLTNEQFQDLPDDPEQAFVEVVAILDDWLARALLTDEPRAQERYLETLRSFADEYELDVPFRSYHAGNFPDWSDYWRRFSNDVAYAKGRLQFRHKLGSRMSASSSVALNNDRRAEIQGLLAKIRKVVAVLEVSEQKRDAIYAKVSALGREVDQSKTRFGTLMALILEGSETFGGAAQKLNPLAKLLSRLTSMVADQKAENEQQVLPKPPDRPRISGPSRSQPPDLDDEIPF